MNSVVYQATTSDAGNTAAERQVSYSIKPDVGDYSQVSIDSHTGAVQILEPANHAIKSEYQFTVVASDGGDVPLSSEQPVTVTVRSSRITRPQLRRVTTIKIGGEIGPSPILFSRSDLSEAALSDSPELSFVVTAVASGRVEKWDGSRWLDVSTAPASSNPRELLALLRQRQVTEGDQIRWVPPEDGNGCQRNCFQDSWFRWHCWFSRRFNDHGQCWTSGRLSSYGLNVGLMLS